MTGGFENVSLQLSSRPGKLNKTGGQNYIDKFNIMVKIGINFSIPSQKNHVWISERNYPVRE